MYCFIVEPPSRAYSDGVRRALKKLQVSAATDPLTGLYNRRLFEEHFERELNRALRYTQQLALVILDLHQFKEVNDRYGHPRGDLLLQTAASTARKSLRASDYAFRIGGDELALLLVQTDSEQATMLAHRVRANFLAAIEPMQMMTALGLDYGVAVFPADGDQRDVLIRTADERLYKMKHLQRAAAAPSSVPSVRQPAPARHTPRHVPHPKNQAHWRATARGSRDPERDVLTQISVVQRLFSA